VPAIDFQLVLDLSTNSEMSLVAPLGDYFFYVEPVRPGMHRSWVSDGTAATTRTVTYGDGTPFDFLLDPDRPTVARDSSHDTNYVVGRDPSNGLLALWKLNATTASVTKIQTAFPILASSERIVFDNQLYFTHHFSDLPASRDHSQLWRYSPTNNALDLVLDIDQPRHLAESAIHSLTAMGNHLAFVGYDELGGHELWLSDGTSANSQRIKDILPGSSSSQIGELTAAGDRFFFTANDGVHGQELWVSDGTDAGTDLVRDIRSGTSSTTIVDAVSAGDNLYFVADDGVHGRELWKSDGTTDGTYLVANINASPAHSNILNLTALNNQVLFTANDGIHGNELWRSDGTASGTQLVRDIHAGSFSGTNQPLAVIGQKVFFQAFDGQQKSLWMSDGTESGTEVAHTFAPGGGLFAGDVWFPVETNRGIAVAAMTFDHGVDMWFHAYADPDFDQNGVYAVADLDLLIREIAASSHNARFDLNSDGQVDLADRDAWLARAGRANLTPPRSYSVGDVNLDGMVDATDFGIWQTNRFQRRTAWSAGDVNADGVVDGSDFSEWNRHKFVSTSDTPAQARMAVRRSPRQAASGLAVWQVMLRRRGWS
jgi:ELWxxDGT repeat protein